MARLTRKLLGEGSFYAAVIVLVTFAAFPFYWMLITSFKTDADLYNLKSDPYWFNTAPTLEHIRGPVRWSSAGATGPRLARARAPRAGTPAESALAARCASWCSSRESRS